MVLVRPRLERVSAALTDAGIAHAFIGAMGRLAWGTVRATNDLDVQVSVESPEDVLRTRQVAGLPVDWAYIEHHARDWAMLPEVEALLRRFGPG